MGKVVLFLLVIISALYLGVGGFLILENDKRYEKALTLETKRVVNDEGLPFDNKEKMLVYEQQKLILNIFPYAECLPSILSFIITAMSFGIIGASAKKINDSIKKEVKLKEDNNLLLLPLQGAMIGLIVLGISYVLPMVLTSDDVSLTPITIVFLSLFGGISYLDFYAWIGGVLKRMVFKDK